MKKLFITSLLLISFTPVIGQEWKLDRFLDEFRNKTDLNYISGYITDGKFTNGSTVEHKLYVLFRAERLNDNIFFGMRLYEHGTKPIKVYTTKYYHIEIETESGAVFFVDGEIQEDGDMLREKEWWCEPPSLELWDTIKDNVGVLKFNIKEECIGHCSTYSFEIDTKDLVRLSYKLKQINGDS